MDNPRHICYKTNGTCSQWIELLCDDKKRIKDVKVIGGCDGNLKGICSLVKGMPLGEVKEKLSGIRCKEKPTSCPDQISKAIAELEQQYEAD